MSKLGFWVHTKSGKWIDPTTKIPWLGYNFDSETMLVTLRPEQVQEFIDKIDDVFPLKYLYSNHEGYQIRAPSDPEFSDRARYSKKPKQFVTRQIIQPIMNDIRAKDIASIFGLANFFATVMRQGRPRLMSGWTILAKAGCYVQ